MPQKKSTHSADLTKEQLKTEKNCSQIIYKHRKTPLRKRPKGRIPRTDSQLPLRFADGPSDSLSVQRTDHRPLRRSPQICCQQDLINLQ